MRPLLRVARVFPEATGSLPVQRASFSFTSRKTNAKLPTSTPGESSEQAFPLGPYYESILIEPQPVPDVKPEQPPTTSPKSPRTTVKKPPPKKPKPTNDNAKTPPASKADSTTAVPPEPTPPPSTAQEKARIVFGSRLAGPIERAERLAALRKRSTTIAGVLVPPRPDEPDNCCMSGCVNCVWDRYRDEMEEWVAASSKAEKALEAQRAHGAPPSKEVPETVSAVKGAPPSPQPPAASAVSMDDDGGGSETNWQADLKKADRPKIAKDLWDDDLYKNVPVGIREFMKQEKRLKEKHAREGTFGA